MMKRMMALSLLLVAAVAQLNAKQGAAYASASSKNAAAPAVSKTAPAAVSSATPDFAKMRVVKVKVTTTDKKTKAKTTVEKWAAVEGKNKMVVSAAATKPTPKELEAFYNGLTPAKQAEFRALVPAAKAGK